MELLNSLLKAFLPASSRTFTYICSETLPVLGARIDLLQLCLETHCRMRRHCSFGHVEPGHLIGHVSFDTVVSENKIDSSS